MAKASTGSPDSEAEFEAAINTALSEQNWLKALEHCSTLERHPCTTLISCAQWRDLASKRKETTYYKNHYVTVHLALLLLTDQLCEAKFLVKRCAAQVDLSPNVQAGFTSCWAAGKALWKNDSNATYRALDTGSWDKRVTPLMQALRERLVSRRMNLLASSYKTISQEKAAGVLGAKSAAEAVDLCQKHGWMVDGSNLKPVAEAVDSSKLQRREIQEDLLKQITSTVLTLESKFQPFIGG